MLTIYVLVIRHRQTINMTVLFHIIDVRGHSIYNISGSVVNVRSNLWQRQFFYSRLGLVYLRLQKQQQQTHYTAHTRRLGTIQVLPRVSRPQMTYQSHCVPTGGPKI